MRLLLTAAASHGTVAYDEVALLRREMEARYGRWDPATRSLQRPDASRRIDPSQNRRTGPSQLP